MNNVDDFIINKYKNKYEDILEKSFEPFYNDLTKNIKRTFVEEDREQTIHNLKETTIRVLKNRWIKKITTDLKSPYNLEIDAARVHYKKLESKEIEEDKVISFYGEKNLNDYIFAMEKNIKEWNKNRDVKLTEFKYLKYFGKRSISTAFKYDVLLDFLAMFNKDIKDDEELSGIIKVPEILSYIPIDTTSRVDLLSDDDKKNLDESEILESPTTIDKIIMIGQDEHEKMLVQLEKLTYLEIKRGGKADKFLDMMTQIALLKSVKYLNSLDVKLVRYYYTNLEKMVLGEPIEKSIYQILTDLDMPNKPFYYEAIENSLAKLGSMNLSCDIEGNSIHGNLLGCAIYEEDDVKKATVYLGGIFQSFIVKKSVFEYDEAVFNSISPDTQQLAIWFQKRRYRAELNGKSYTEVIGLSAFSTAIYWNTKRKDRQRDRILKSLEELKANNLIIKEFSFERFMYSFTVEYLPLTSRELRKLNVSDKNKNHIVTDTKYKLE